MATMYPISFLLFIFTILCVIVGTVCAFLLGSREGWVNKGDRIAVTIIACVLFAAAGALGCHIAVVQIDLTSHRQSRG